MLFTKDSKEKINNLNNSVNALTDIISELKDSIISSNSKLNDSIENLSSRLDVVESKVIDINRDFLSKYDEITKLSKSLNSQVDEFKISRNNMASKIIVELSSQFNDQVKKMKIDLNNYNVLKQSITELFSKTDDMKSNIDKFNLVMKEVKKVDFTLDKYAKNLHNNDREKLKLMKEVDNLQRIVASQRRRK